MTDELKVLAGSPTSGDFLKNLRWKDLIEFAERFGVGVDELEKLEPALRYKAFAWLAWKASGCKVEFDEYLEQPLPTDLFQS